MGCSFCKTGALGFARNLGADEIVEQYHHLAALGSRPGNIVFMGMGEPLLNLPELRQAVAIFTHPAGLHLSARKITISTCGVVPGIRELADKGPRVRLAVSLTCAEDEIRDSLMPVNRSWNLAILKETLSYYQARTGDRITLEVAVMDGVNSSKEDARRLAGWIGTLAVQINVIPWNPVAGLPFRSPDTGDLERFETELEKAGLTVVRRMRRGRGIGAACGQLGTVVAEIPPDRPAARVGQSS